MELNEIAVMCKSGNMKAKELLYSSMKNDIKNIASSYAKRMQSKDHLEDYESQAVLGLFEAVDSFDPQKGAFRNYSSAIMRDSIRKYITNYQFTIRLPRYIHDNMSMIRNAAEGSAELDVHEISKKTGLSEKNIKDAIAATASRQTLSFDFAYSNDNGDERFLSDVLTDNISTEDIVIDNYIDNRFQTCLEKLSEKDRFLLCSEYGAFGVEKIKTQALADRYNVSTTTIRNWRHDAASRLSDAAGFY